MPKYILSWIEEVIKEAYVEADSLEQARDIFNKSEYTEWQVVGQEMTDSLEIEEVEED